MNAQRWQKVRALFDAVVELAPPDRARVLKASCIEDAELRRSVENLLAANEDAEDFLEQPAVSEVAELIVEPPVNLAAGTIFGRYEIVRRIGAGGMGEVYLAKDTKLDRLVAVKILNEKFAEYESNPERFTREAKAASALNHPNILIIHEIGEAENSNYIVSEYIEGVTLREHFKFSPLATPEILDIAVQIAGALVAAHRARIVHRDIKPENVMIRPDGYVKILDFGLAKLVERKAVGFDESTVKQNQTARGVILGTVKYMSPEQAKGEKVDERADIFSFGILIYEMLAGRTPFAGDSVSETFANLINAEPPPLAKFSSNAPDELQRIVTKTLRKKKDERYQTAKDLLFDLKSLQKRLEFETELGRGGGSSPDKERANKTETLENASRSGALRTPPNNLTKNLSRLVGREKEIAELIETLSHEDVRLVTMTGIGGTGKTRLAQAVADGALRDFSTAFADGVFFVELAAVSDGALVASAVAERLGVREAGGKAVLEVLKNYLRDKRMLLVVDNFEQVLSAAPDLAELLDAAPGLKLLVTSRELLRVRTEREYIVPPLAVPSGGGAVSVDDLQKYEAVRLFVERAQNVKPGFILTAENAPSVAEICARLNGLPLAIELAAARIKLLSPAAILAKLESQLKLLTGGARDLPARQQTMRGAIAWSCELLAESEKRLFERLAIFAGGFTLEAAEAVCRRQEAEGGRGQSFDESIGQTLSPNDNQFPPTAVAVRRPLLAEFDVLDGITSLVDKSLIVLKEQNHGDVRFRMLEVVREFALEGLEKSRAAEAMRRSHAVYFLAFAEEAEPFLQAAQSSEWLNRLEDEHDNLRAAIRWASRNDAELGEKLVAAIWRFWWLHGYVREGCEQLSAFLSRGAGDSADKQTRTKMLLGAGFLNRVRGNFAAARSYAEAGFALAQETGDKKSGAFSLYQLGLLALDAEEFADAESLLEKGLLYAEDSGDRQILALLLNGLGEFARSREDYERAADFYRQALIINREIGDLTRQVTNLVNLGATALSQKNLDAAGAFYRDGLNISSKMVDMNGTLYCLEGLAGAFWAVRNAERAALLFGAAEAAREANNLAIEPTDRAPYDQSIALVRDSLTEKAFTGLRTDGRKLKLEEAIALALEQQEKKSDETKLPIPGTERTIPANFSSSAAGGLAPAGKKESPEINASSLKSGYVVALLVFLLAAGGLGYYFWSSKQTPFKETPANAGGKKSLAVLPFVNAGRDADAEYLSEGIAESVINNLSQLSNLRVMSKNSAFRFRNDQTDHKNIAAQLGVETLVTGDIRQIGDNFIINVRLIDATDDSQIWGSQYVKDSADLLAAQTEIAQAVAGNLRLKLVDDERRRLDKRPTENAAAYEIYLKANYFYFKLTRADINKAIGLYEQAIDLDPNFALAYVGMANAYRTLAITTYAPSKEVIPKAKAAARRALEIDESLAEAHATLGWTIFLADWDWRLAEKELKRAVELAPNNADVRRAYAHLLSNIGRHDEAVLEGRLSRELDPLTLISGALEAQFLFYAGRSDEAVARINKTLELAPNFWQAHTILGRIYTRRERYPEAVAALRKARELADGSTEPLTQLGYALAKSGDRAGARQTLEELKMIAARNYVPAYNHAMIHNGLGETVEALNYLEKSFDEREVQMSFIKIDTRWDNLRGEPRFVELLRRMNFD